MSGTSRSHSLIVTNATVALATQLRNRPCETHASNLRVRVTPTTYVYPDIVVCCGEPEFEDEQLDTLLNPTVIIEVLSPSTENWDRGGKFERYRRLESLTDYILVSQSEHLVEHRTRQTNASWLLSEIEGPDAIVTIASIDCTLPLADLFNRVVVAY